LNYQFKYAVKMIGAILNEPNEIEISELQTPDAQWGEVRIKIEKVGICGSDVHFYKGHRLLEKPTLIGHEGLGIIDQIGGGVLGREIGERVVIEPNIPCQKCKFCLSGRGNICINKRVIGVNEHGCFAEYICVPEAFAWKIPESISDENAVTIEPMAVAYSALFSAKTKPGDAIAVLGLGAIGLLLTHLALRLGYKVLVTELNPEKLKMATEMGAIPVESVGNLFEQTKIISKIWLVNNVEAIFECAGSEFTASLATASAPRGSEIILVGLSEKNASFQPLKIAREGITIVPSIIYDHPFDFKRVIQLIANKTIEPSFVISSYEPLSNIKNALERASNGDESKVVILVS
jgi:L-iditol 2-dehydrogenase